MIIEYITQVARQISTNIMQVFGNGVENADKQHIGAQRIARLVLKILLHISMFCRYSA